MHFPQFILLSVFTLGALSCNNEQVDPTADCSSSVVVTLPMDDCLMYSTPIEKDYECIEESPGFCIYPLDTAWLLHESSKSWLPYCLEDGQVLRFINDFGDTKDLAVVKTHEIENRYYANQERCPDNPTNWVNYCVPTEIATFTISSLDGAVSLSLGLQVIQGIDKDTLLPVGDVIGISVADRYKTELVGTIYTYGGYKYTFGQLTFHDEIEINCRKFEEVYEMTSSNYDPNENYKVFYSRNGGVIGWVGIGTTWVLTD